MHDKHNQAWNFFFLSFQYGCFSKIAINTLLVFRLLGSVSLCYCHGLRFLLNANKSQQLVIHRNTGAQLNTRHLTFTYSLLYTQRLKEDMRILANNLPATCFFNYFFVGLPLLNSLKLNPFMLICSIIAFPKPVITTHH